MTATDGSAESTGDRTGTETQYRHSRRVV